MKLMSIKEISERRIRHIIEIKKLETYTGYRETVSSTSLYAIGATIWLFGLLALNIGFIHSEILAFLVFFGALIPIFSFSIYLSWIEDRKVNKRIALLSLMEAHREKDETLQ